MQTFFLVLSLILAAGCVSTPTATNIGNGFNIIQQKSSKMEDGHGATRIEYKPYELVIEQFKQREKLKMTPEGKITEKIKSIGKGGYVLVHIDRLTIGAANTKIFNYVVSKDSKVLQRIKGKHRLPRPPKNRRGFWTNIDVIEIKNSIGNDFNFYVIDPVYGREEFRVSK